MPDSIMYQEDGFVVLEPDQPEQFLTAEELLEKLKAILLTRQDDLPRELVKIPSVEGQAQYLMENFCDLDVGPDSYLQWYVVRLQK
ncbi:chlororespiratory reduction protein 7 [Crocosphaera sp. UHCC 0190]|uniref:chlororespiratory reduction protein 7 n=1 Tax=Crocosphaera sp. UHCC 0190 TaxID=3110246 RepID=UPI002B206784|nr:chlororespiratory reduction protein 7 [Crocosphaera sp. UHCC 0190]MEA5508553.1 chlororespiratory reduction protein 7 [Crocosphaera sp. UHCC 0190]